MTLELGLNPRGVEEEYLRSLNECFPGWGDERAYAWAFQRDAGAGRPDMMVLREGGHAIAGSAVSYRLVVLANGATISVGIMTGSWTLPEARGKGCFARFIQESVARSRERECGLLLAFVTETNASRRQLERAGSAMFDTHYLVTGPDTPPAKSQLGVELVQSADIAAMHAAIEQQGVGDTRFTYPTYKEWSGQVLERIGQVEVVRVGDMASAVIERAADTDRVLALAGVSSGDSRKARLVLSALLQDAQSRRRKLFTFAAGSAVPGAAAELGLARTPGFLTTLIADHTALASALDTSGEVSPPAHGELLDRKSAWHLGAWYLQNGDRI